MTDTAKKMDYSSLSSSLQNKMHMQRVSNKEKVLLFEKELEDSLKKMDMIELEMIQISKQRKEWLDNISSTYIVGSDTYLKRLELIKHQLEEVSYTLELNLIDLESIKEKHMLNLLIETTKTIKSEDEGIDINDYNDFINLNDINEEEFNSKAKGRSGTRQAPQSTRVQSLKLLQMKQAKEFEAFLMDMIKIVQKSNNFLRDLHQNTKILRENSEADLKNQVNEWKNNVLSYIKNMNENSEKSKAMYNIITKEYLVVRHNSNVAKEILLRTHNKIEKKKLFYSEKIGLIKENFDQNKHAIEHKINGELSNIISNIRANLVYKENKYDMINSYIHNLRINKVKDIKKVKKEIKDYDRQHVILENKRKKTIAKDNQELEALRRKLSSLEKLMVTCHKFQSKSLD